jgi:hypothetical protein
MTEITTLVIAVLGAVTGVIGTVLSIGSLRREIDRDRVKLKVTVSWGLSMASPDVSFLGVHVTNLSTFPVTLREVGLLFDHDRQRAIHFDALTGRGERLPQRMDPRTSLTIRFPPDFLLDRRLKTARCAYVWTDCGHSFESKGDDIPKMVAGAQREHEEFASAQA